MGGMGDRIDSKIEDHRRDPDPHPRMQKAIDAALVTLTARIDALDPDIDGDTGLQLGSDLPKTITSSVTSSAGISDKAAREDHQHDIELPSSLDIDGVGVVTRDADGVLVATQDPTVTGMLTAGALRADAQAGLVDRVLLADPDGTQRAEPAMTWTGAWLQVGGSDVVTVGRPAPYHSSFGFPQAHTPIPPRPNIAAFTLGV
jgi:hypothetical protein